MAWPFDAFEVREAAFKAMADLVAAQQQAIDALSSALGIVRRLEAPKPERGDDDQAG